MVGEFGLTASGVTVAASLGAFGIALDDGSIGGTVGVDVTLADPGTTVDARSAGRIDLRELIGGVVSPGSLVDDLDLSGSLSMTGLIVTLDGFARVSGNFVLARSTVASLVVTDGSSREALMDVPLLTLSSDSGSLFAGIDAGGAAAKGFSATITDVAIAILEEPAGGRIWQSLSGTVNSASLSGIAGFSAAATELEVQVNATASDGTFVDFSAIDVDGDGVDGALRISTGSGEIAIDYDTAVLALSGAVTVQVQGFVTLSGSFGFERSGAGAGQTLKAVATNVDAGLEVGDYSVGLTEGTLALVLNSDGTRALEVSGNPDLDIPGFDLITAQSVRVQLNDSSTEPSRTAP